MWIWSYDVFSREIEVLGIVNKSMVFNRMVSSG